MKQSIITAAFALLCTGAIAQTNPTSTQPAKTGDKQQGMYKDIHSGKPLDLRYDAATSTMYNRNTNKPVDFFINNGGDTISSHGFYVVNNYLSLKDNEYSLDKTKSSMRDKKLWGTTSNKELEQDKNWKSYTGAEKMKKDSLQ